VFRYIRIMTLRTLSSIALVYGVLTTVWGLLLLADSLKQTSFADADHDILTYQAILLLHGIAQVIYVFRTRTRLEFPRYENLGTLDNDLFFGADKQVIYRNSLFVIGLAVFATIIELILAYLSVMSVRSLPALVSSRPLLGILYIVCILGALPAVLYNLRTWNMERVLLVGDRDARNDG